jgi:hypothetical protein
MNDIFFARSFLIPAQVFSTGAKNIYTDSSGLWLLGCGSSSLIISKVFQTYFPEGIVESPRALNLSYRLVAQRGDFTRIIEALGGERYAGVPFSVLIWLINAIQKKEIALAPVNGLELLLIRDAENILRPVTLSICHGQVQYLHVHKPEGWANIGRVFYEQLS